MHTVIPTSPLLVCLPAMGTPAGYYQPLADALRHAGCCDVQLMELRGQGNHPVRAREGHDFGFREIVEHDIPRLLEDIARDCPGRPVYLLGHSLGGQLAVLASATLSRHLAGLILVASGTAHFRAWPERRRWRAWWTVQAIRLAATLLPWYPGTRLGFGGDQPRRLMRDWYFNASTGRYQMEGCGHTAERIADKLRKVRLPVLSIAVRGDPLAPSGARAELLAKLPFASVERREIAGVHEHAPWKRHFSWARAPQEAAQCIASWLRRQAYHRVPEYRPLPRHSPVIF